ncbi:phosphoinositide phosphatase SAC2-like [Spinacia oleracea]|uniref:Phosphoinositide phosphatase SAC2-like n=1 Tax=Spinacia oleracea TaxID=3562 RepID=A0A9R0JUF2_SPIOL|nr:phosphoinositide phosphatase SAC2-like [Spinacia oleracea]
MVELERSEEAVNHKFLPREEIGLENDKNNNDYNDLIREQGECSSSSSPSYYLDKFTLYETLADFYMIGRDAEGKNWRVMKIGRSKPSELDFYEYPTTYAYEECQTLLRNIHENNLLTGGLKIVANCYGIIGFIKFVKSYYILLVTERGDSGKMYGHQFYSVVKYKMIPICHTTALKYMYNSTKENRYKKLLQLLDLRDNFFFSYTYPLMHRLQHNLSNQDTEQSCDKTMFVWNEYLTLPIRDCLKSTLWTVALIHGFVKQVQLSTGGNNFFLTLIARRSCRFAGTRYEKRGINKDGQAANDVEIEQIVWQDIDGKCPTEITSVVQNRASIPLFWSQKPSSFFNLKPDILLSEDNGCYEATRLHFQNLQLRYGMPIVILNLVKTSKKKHREYILHQEFQKAVDSIKKDLPEEDQLEFLSLDLDAVFQNQDADEVIEVKHMAVAALEKTGIFSCQMPQSINFKASSDLSYTWVNSSDSNSSCKEQKGILRSNCLDSLDRTNFAQFVYGMVSLGLQLHTLGITESKELDCQNPLAFDLMNLYQAMGDALSQQYAGSPAHHKIFSKIRGQYKMATQFQEFMKSIQRHCSNSFTDISKQQAIDIFLGHCQPESDSGELTPRRNNLYQGHKCGWINSIYLNNLTRCNICIYSGFERLWLESDDSGPLHLTERSGSSQHQSQEGFPMVDFSAGS